MAAAFGLTNGCAHGSIEHLEVWNCRATCQVGTDRSSHITWFKVTIRDSGGTGVRGLWLGDTNVGWNDHHIDVLYSRVYANSGSGIVLVGNDMLAQGNYASLQQPDGSGIISPSSLANPIRRHRILGNTCEGNAYTGWGTDVPEASAFAEDMCVVGNIFKDNSGGETLWRVNGAQFVGNSLINEGLETNIADGVLVVANEFRNSAGIIQTTAPTNSLITPNLFF